ncbi:hypothetical protein GH714_021939 [Hevea brasiliensis]|uniref:HTH OST-type domain-containing protein n=1 Tax=Hevea brasiliensis TaxID=3981 RepID=A0A6A6KTS4_HEVBR|nr:hypothetical protein GH714_021939 [Hevea brasiliensis]
MDFTESTKVVYNRIQKLDPANVSKIIGYLLLQDHGEREMIRLAFSPDNLIYSLITKAKSDLGLNKPGVSTPISPSQVNSVPALDIPLQFTPFSPASPRPASSPVASHRAVSSYWDAQVFPWPSNVRKLFSDFQPKSNEISSEEHFVLPGSLEKLEMEITELLRSRRGMPVSIASLPIMYYEKYGRTLQAEGYLTESQRHGKAGYSLTKLLARLKNSIRVIDRPHGQHSVILAEDVPKCFEYAGERNDPGGIVAGSRQIYLTFPAESTFTEQDVSNYFRKYSEKIQPSIYYGPHFIDGDSELHSMTKVYGNSRIIRKQLMDEQEHALELETRRLSELNLGSKSLNHNSYFGSLMDELKLSEAPAEQAEFPSAERFNYFLDVLNNGSSSEEKLKHTSTNYGDQDRKASKQARQLVGL